MEYEFKVGDYVENIYGKVGYIQEVSNNILNIVYNNEKETKIIVDDGYTIYNQINFKKYYKRIGKYDFTKKEKIKPLEIIKEKYDQYYNGVFIKHLPDSNRLPNNKELMDKINEIIEYINKEE